MMAHDIKKKRAAKRQARVRGHVQGSAERPRLAVSKSLRNISAQLVDDEKKVTLAAATSAGKEFASRLSDKKKKTEIAALVGQEIASRAIAKGIKRVAFDRNRNLYHGRVKALAEAARKAGLEF